MNTEQPTPPAVVLSTALLDAFDKHTRSLVARPHPMTPEMWPKSFPFFEAGWNAAIEHSAALCRAEGTFWKAQGQSDARDFEIAALCIERSNVM